jgi:hypothetical protein
MNSKTKLKALEKRLKSLRKYDEASEMYPDELDKEITDIIVKHDDTIQLIEYLSYNSRAKKKTVVTEEGTWRFHTAIDLYGSKISLEMVEVEFKAKQPYLRSLLKFFELSDDITIDMYVPLKKFLSMRLVTGAEPGMVDILTKLDQVSTAFKAMSSKERKVIQYYMD